jgi:hypothetical protein
VSGGGSANRSRIKERTSIVFPSPISSASIPLQARTREEGNTVGCREGIGGGVEKRIKKNEVGHIGHAGACDDRDGGGGGGAPFYKREIGRWYRLLLWEERV